MENEFKKLNLKWKEIYKKNRLTFVTEQNSKLITFLDELDIVDVIMDERTTLAFEILSTNGHITVPEKSNWHQTKIKTNGFFISIEKHFNVNEDIANSITGLFKELTSEIKKIAEIKEIEMWKEFCAHYKNHFKGNFSKDMNNRYFVRIDGVDINITNLYLKFKDKKKK
jgi:hypothetical protein